VVRVLTCLGVFILLSALIFAQESNLTCQYRYNTTEQVEKLNVYDNATGQFVTNSIRTQFDGFGLNLYNDYEVPLTVRVMFDYRRGVPTAAWTTTQYKYDNTITIAPRPNYYIIQEGITAYNADPNKDSLKLIFQDNNETYAKYEKENVTKSNCQLCNGNICLDDGATCGSPSECGGGHCVAGRCSPSQFCYQNNCLCGENAFQCQNKVCVPKNAVSPGGKTMCNASDECAAGIKDNAGYCKLADGEQCSSPNECGSGFCVVGRCSTDKYCYQGDCLCGVGEISCENIGCVPKGSIEAGTKTTCNLKDECKTGIMDSNGVCVKSIWETTKEAAKVTLSSALSLVRYVISIAIVPVIILLVILTAFYLYWGKLEKASQNAAKQRERERQKAHQDNGSQQRQDRGNKNEYEAACDALGVGYDESYQTCKKKWLNWQKIYHRDTMSTSHAETMHQAEEQLKKINAAWDLIKETRGWA